ncbi:glycosyl hydrolase [Sphingomonas sp. CFBP 13706]|uniref:glycosyl hydrolase n=1 Tax=Sphingomonas sp. CFBP 13706 TaxID=2775314 RepID=UPI001786B303|nr:glycosyl hydrolase [Sphingomonas sp. CFBP 13706]MBD8737222.1 glycoside hydrolase [Sphingomonas sp. CFBP 13706]
MRRSTFAAAFAAILMATTAGFAQNVVPDPLRDGFRNPPPSARPRTWWHWLNGNISEDGIDKDLTWMRDIGLGGVQAFDANLMTPQVVAKRIAYMSPEWKRAFRRAATTAERLNLELAIAASPGWSETGGPWVPPADGMKKLVWSEMDVVGGRPLSAPLAMPPSVTGPFQSLPFSDQLAGFDTSVATKPRARYYADVAVLAYPVLARDGIAPVVMSGATGDAAALADDDATSAVQVARGTAVSPSMLTLAYAEPTTIRSATLLIPGALPVFGDAAYLPVLEAQTGAGWKPIATLPLANVPTTVAFAPVNARTFRLVLRPNTGPKRTGVAPPAPGVEMGAMFGGGAPVATLPIAELRLSSEAKVDRYEAKAGFATVPDYHALSRDVPDITGVEPGQVVDLTRRMRSDGTLDWTPPPGRWRIVRLGTSLLGTTNHPASPEATGLEVDKYDGAAVRRYLDTYLDTYRDAVGADLIGAKGIRALVTDSFEAGDANWTLGMVAAFRRLRGYDPTPWLPTLTGAVIGSRARSDAFLYDYRATLADLISNEHYGTVAAVAHARGLKVYGEALEDGRPALGNDIAMRSHTDVPMAAMWTFSSGGEPRSTLVGDIRGAASVAHLYGQNLVAAESMTSAFSPWAFAPADLRHVIDMEFALGVNRPVIHTSVHQPVDDKQPGLSLAIFGQYFNRHETWAGMAKPWVDYMARSSFLLQQGRAQADVAYFFGEEAPLTALYAQAALRDVPKRYGYDFVDAAALKSVLSMTDGQLAASGGARYRVLYLGGSSARMTLPTLQRIATLVEDGLTVIGEAPTGTPALQDDAAAFSGLVRRLWTGTVETRVGKGRVIAGRDLERRLALIGVVADLDYDGIGDGPLVFTHRTLKEDEVYFIANRRTTAQAREVRFRVTGRVPELWHADTGITSAVSYRTEGGQTIVPLELASEESVFVVFRNRATTPQQLVNAPAARRLARIEGPWMVRFQPGRGAPKKATSMTLTPLDRHATPGIRYFSGVASYSTDVQLPPSTPAERRFLDLGTVGDVAEVRINGIVVGTVWHAPYRLDVSGALKAGRNRVEVRVANLWVNRLVGDAQPGEAKIAWTATPAYRSDAPLRPSGLIGPVSITAETAR